MNLSDLMRTRRAVRQFSDQPVPEETIRAILNAGRRAQSSKNGQPWHFVVIRDKAKLKELSTCGAYAGHLAGAAFAVALVASEPADFDLGQAADAMQLLAWDQGVGSCIASIYEPERARAILGIPADAHLDVALSFGYPLPGQERPPRAGGRKPLEEVVHWEKW
jgi:nitroreductase